MCLVKRIYCSHPNAGGTLTPNLVCILRRMYREGQKMFLIHAMMFSGGKQSNGPRGSRSEVRAREGLALGSYCDLGMQLCLAWLAWFKLSTHAKGGRLRFLPGLPRYGGRGTYGGVGLYSCQQSNVKNGASLFSTEYHIINIYYLFMKINVKLKFDGYFYRI